MTQTVMNFDGPTFSPQYDVERLTSQLAKVFTLMRDGHWRTLGEIADSVGGSEAGVSARLRDFRKERFGGHSVERRRRGEPSDGLFEYRLVIRETWTA